MQFASAYTVDPPLGLSSSPASLPLNTIARGIKPLKSAYYRIFYVHLTWTSLPRTPSRCILEQLQRSAERLVITSVAATYGLPLPAGPRR